MKSRYAIAAALLCALFVSSVAAAELTSGVQVDGKVTSYLSKKCGGVDDGYPVGTSFCYT
jgi:hypothetical protein